MDMIINTVNRIVYAFQILMYNYAHAIKIHK